MTILRSAVCFIIASSVAFLLFLAPCAARASETPSVKTTENETSTWTEKFQLHGHITTAYADFQIDKPRNLFVEESILGIPEDGTFDYRMAALQLRYVPNNQHSAVLQVSHRRFGESILLDVEDDVELDWLFWRWNLANTTTLRVGRFPTPAGIFNEIRDVGTLLPFFRPSFNFYREGGLFSETVDGLGVHHTFFGSRAWSLDTDVYAGEFDVTEQTQGIGAGVREVGAEDAVGAQIWLNSPIVGLRFGLGGLRWDVGPESGLNPIETTWESWYASVDGSFDRWVVRAEYRNLELPVDVGTVFTDGRAELDFYYWQIGWHATPELSFFFQSEYADFTQFHDSLVGGKFSYNNRRDEGIAVNYRIRPTVVAKAEVHKQRLDDFSGAPVFTDEGLRFRIDNESFESEYWIVSLSYSF